MISGLALLLAGAHTPPAHPPAHTPQLVAPANWSAMPPLPWRTPPVLSPDFEAFVASEIQAGRCVAPPGGAVAVEVAVYVRADGRVRAAIPRAIDCPRVEQFAAGLVTSYARNNLRRPAAGWYHVALTFDRTR